MAFSFEKVGQVVTVYKADTTQHRSELKKLSKEQQEQHKEVIARLDAQANRYEKSIIGIKKMHSSVMLLSAAFPILGQVAGKALDAISQKAEQGYREIYRAAQMLDRYVMKRRSVNFDESTDPRAARISDLKAQLELAKQGPTLTQIGYSALTSPMNMGRLATDYLDANTNGPKIQEEIDRLTANMKFTGGTVGAGKMPALPFAGSTTGIGHWEMNPDTLMWAWVAGEPAPTEGAGKGGGGRRAAELYKEDPALRARYMAAMDENAARRHLLGEAPLIDASDPMNISDGRVRAYMPASTEIQRSGKYPSKMDYREKAASIMGGEDFKMVSGAMMGSFQAVIAGSMGVSQAMRAMFGQVIAGYSAKLFAISIEQGVLAAASFGTPAMAKHIAAAGAALAGAGALAALARKLGGPNYQGGGSGASGFGRGIGGGGGGGNRTDSRTFIIGDGFGDDSPRRRASKIRRMLDDDDKRGGGSSGGRWN